MNYTAINIDGATIDWDSNAGKLEFLGIPAIIFWLNPSLLRMLEPLRQEIGDELYYLLVAQHASLGTAEDYYQIVNELGSTFKEGFLEWGKVVSAAGWGVFELISFDQNAKTATVRVRNAWELSFVDIDSNPSNKLCPFLMGKITGIFSHAFNTKCWAFEGNIKLNKKANSIDFNIFEHDLSFSEEVSNLRALKKKQRELKLEAEIAKRVKQQIYTERERSKLAQAVEQTGESIMITDVAGTIEYVNPAFTKITGYRREEVIGENPRILKSGKQTAEYYKALWKTISSGNVWHSSVIDRRKDGSEYPAMATISPIKNEDGETTHYVGIQQDMSSHRELEEKFLQAQKMEGMGTLVAGVAHDFNNMLAAMTGNLYLIKKKVNHMPDVVGKVEVIEKLAFSSADMIKQLLGFSRNSNSEMKEFEFTSFIKECSGSVKV